MEDGARSEGTEEVRTAVAYRVKIIVSMKSGERRTRILPSPFKTVESAVSGADYAWRHEELERMRATVIDENGEEIRVIHDWFDGFAEK